MKDRTSSKDAFRTLSSAAAQSDPYPSQGWRTPSGWACGVEGFEPYCVVREIEGVFYVSGELDGLGGDVLRDAVTPALSEDRTHVVLDVSKVTFIDSMGFSAIAMLAVGLTDGVVVRSPQRSMTRLFDVIRARDMPGIRIERA